MDSELKWKLLGWSRDTLGIYPQKVSGGEHPYKKRSGYMEGWNACVKALFHAYYDIEKAFKTLDDPVALALATLVEDGIVFWMHSKKENSVSLEILISDTFHYACADGEPLLFEEVPAFRSINEKYGVDGVTAWVSVKRGGVDPLDRYNTDKFRAARIEILESKQESVLSR